MIRGNGHASYQVVERPKDLPGGAWSDPASRVLRERYLMKSAAGELLEDPEDLCWRVAWAVAEAELHYGVTGDAVTNMARDFYTAMVTGHFLPNSPTLMNAGKDCGLSCAACFVLPISDSIDDIFQPLAQAARIQKAGGGTGFAFSSLRPKGSYIRSSGGRSSGPVSFLREAFDHMTSVIKQGSTRRGANMAVLRVDHPDILEFISAKSQGGLPNFNVSVAITDEFMAALEAGTDYLLRARAGWPRPDGLCYADDDPYLDPESAAPMRLSAVDVWARICEAAWTTGDPGLFFIDRANRSSASPVPGRFTIESTNPCGEVPLYANDQCILGSLNLASFVDQRARLFRWNELATAVRLAVRFLDNVVDISPAPTSGVAEMARDLRRIGVGVMGWADALVLLGIPYDSDRAVALAEELMAFVTAAGEAATVDLAKQRGPFPLWSQSIYRDGPPRRNATVTTIAPTGTISVLAGCSAGIEPHYGVAFTHRVKREDGERILRFVNPLFAALMREHGGSVEALIEEVARSGRVRATPGVPDEIKRLFPTAHELSPDWHVRHQAAFQRHTHNAVSKTVNLPGDAKVADVSRAYRLAWDQRCVGITVYRDGCKSTQVLTSGIAIPGAGSPTHSDLGDAPSTLMGPRPRCTEGQTFKVETPLGLAYITVTMLDGEPLEVFLNVGKSGTDTTAMSEAIGRLISTILRLQRLPTRKQRAEEIWRQLRHIGGSRDVGFGVNRVRSIPDAVASVLYASLHPLNNHASGQSPSQSTEANARDLCPECNTAAVVYEEGCRRCMHCHRYSEC